MEVRITFTGLFFFSKGIKDGVKHMRALMSADSSGDHEALLRYRLQYDQNNLGAEIPLQLKQELELGRGSDYSEALPRSIANISATLGEGDRKRLREAKSNGMFRLFGGHVVSTQDLYPLSWGNQTNLSLAWRVVWSIETMNTTCEFNVVHKNGSTTPVKLKPAVDSDVIEFDIYYLPKGQLANIDKPVAYSPRSNQTAAHFVLHYGLFDGVSPSDVPEYTGLRRPVAILATRAIEPITCLPGGCDDCCEGGTC
jgi:hypothetical protein